MPLIVLLSLGSSTPSYAHGTERHFGTPINGRGAGPATDGRSGSPAFTLLALTANLNGLERDLREGRTSEVRKRARRLPAMARDLVARSRSLGRREREQVDVSAQVIAEGAERIFSAAPSLEADRVLHEVNLVRARIAALEDLFRNAED